MALETATRTLAGAITELIVSETRRGTLKKVQGSLVEGTRDTASVWMEGPNGTYFQVHVTELHPTASELEGIKRCGR